MEVKEAVVANLSDCLWRHQGTPGRTSKLHRYCYLLLAAGSSNGLTNAVCPVLSS